MKGVSMLRITIRPHAYCVEEDSDGVPGCGFERYSSRFNSAQTVCAEAQRHVRDTGHQVFVDIVDRTSYDPEVTP